MARGVINYIERQRQVLLHDFLVYVCGVDITPYVKSLGVTYTDRNSPSSVDITLTNAFEQWILTEANFKGYWRMQAGKYSEYEKNTIFLKKRQLSVQTVRYKNDPRKNDPQQYVTKVPSYTEDGIDRGRLLNLTDAENQDFQQRYSFGPGNMVFSRFDTVKVYVKNPTDHEDVNRWIPFFTGTVEGKNEATDFVTGSSNITLTCYDIRAVMQGMRIAINPVTNQSFDSLGRPTNQQLVLDEGDVGFFADFYPGLTRGVLYDNFFTNRSFVDSVSLILTGKVGWVSGPAVTDVFQGAAVGYFQPGQVYRYANPGNRSATPTGKHVTDLEEWDNLCLFGSKQRFWTERECRADGALSFWTESLKNSSESRTPMNGNVHWLIPAEGLDITNTITQSQQGLNNVTGPLDWVDRLSLITNFLRKIDYEMTVTGAGDFVFEFPLYDFFPSNFGSNASLYVIDQHVKANAITDESGDITTGLEVQTLSTDQAKAGSDQAYNQEQLKLLGIGKRAVVSAPIMASRYGVRVSNMSVTGVADSALEKFATFEFQKQMADVNKLSFEASFRPYIRPNRPILHKTRERLGKSTTVRYNYTAFQAPTMSIALHCVRLPIYIAATNSIGYQHITGGAAMALSYNQIFEPTGGQIANNNAAIAVKVLDNRPNVTTPEPD